MPRSSLPHPKKSGTAIAAEATVEPKRHTGRAAKRPRKARPSPRPEPVPRARRDRRPLKAGGHGARVSEALKRSAGRRPQEGRRTAARAHRSGTTNVRAAVRADRENGSALQHCRRPRAAHRQGRRKRTVPRNYRPCGNRGPPKAQPEACGSVWVPFGKASAPAAARP